MAASHQYLAIDLGAESGRVMLGQFDGERFHLAEAHRFASLPVCLPDGLHTDVLRIWSEIKHGLALGVQQAGGALAGVGVDTWGVDFALLDRQGALLANPYHYRDSLTDGILDEAFRHVPREEIFEQTGIQFMPINTLYQLLALKLRAAPVLEIAATLLMMPDLFNYWLSGRKASEFTIATTSQCYDPRRGDWAKSLMEKLDLPTHILPPIIAPGTIIGDVLPSLAEEIGCPAGWPVIAPGCHDTALAVAAVPAQENDFVYLSSGTWSLMGAELREPWINSRSLAGNFTNEGGVCRTFRFLKNITGLWVLQECRRTWARRGEELSYAELIRQAKAAEPLRSFIDVDDGEFAKPGDMPARMRAFCRRTDQPVPESTGAVVRCALESLALKYRQVLGLLEATLGRRLEPLHIVGGGSRNALLNRFAADATGRRVVAGPVEATAIGSLIMQAMALGHIRSLAEGRELVRRSFDVVSYEPGPTAGWDQAYQRYAGLIRQ